MVTLVVVSLSVPAVDAEVGTAFERHVERLLGTPTPIGPVLFLSDRATWEMELDAATVVWIEADAPGSSPFYLTTSCNSLAVLLPSTHEGRLCSKPGVWRIDVDPAGGAAVDITVRFRGHVGDLRGAPSAFRLTNASADDDARCIVPGVCLP